MKRALLKISVPAILALLQFTMPLHAGNYCPSITPYENPLPEDSCYPDCAYFDDFHLSANFLYWRCSENLKFGKTTSAEIDGLTLTQRARDLHFRWAPGVRLGIGYDYQISGLDTELYVTYFYDSAKAHKDHLNEGVWGLNYYVVDAVAGYSFEPIPSLALRPFGGIRGAWINQRFNSEFLGLLTSDSEVFILSTKEKKKQRFWGVGPELGLEVNWSIAWGFGLYGSVSGAIFYGNFDVISDEIEKTPTSVSIESNRHHHYTCQYAFDASLGMSWSTCICEETLLILKAGYENHSYFDYNQIGNKGGLYLNGMTLSATLEY